MYHVYVLHFFYMYYIKGTDDACMKHVYLLLLYMYYMKILLYIISKHTLIYITTIYVCMQEYPNIIVITRF